MAMRAEMGLPKSTRAINGPDQTSVNSSLGMNRNVPK